MQLTWKRVTSSSSNKTVETLIEERLFQYSFEWRWKRMSQILYDNSLKITQMFLWTVYDGCSLNKPKRFPQWQFQTQIKKKKSFTAAHNFQVHKIIHLAIRAFKVTHRAVNVIRHRHFPRTHETKQPTPRLFRKDFFFGYNANKKKERNRLEPDDEQSSTEKRNWGSKESVNTLGKIIFKKNCFVYSVDANENTKYRANETCNDFQTIKRRRRRSLVMVAYTKFASSRNIKFHLMIEAR